MPPVGGRGDDDTVEMLDGLLADASQRGGRAKNKV